jgi:DNA-binding XRE family transcriptional regulator
MAIPIPVARALRKLGEDMKDARRRRRIPTELMAERASISRTTLNKIEKGEPTVAIVAYIRVLFILGMLDRVNELVDVRFDRLGQHLDMDRLPKRIRIPKTEE